MISHCVGLFFFHFLNWRIIALQNFVVFCQISTWSAIGIHTSSPFWNSLPSPSPLHPSGLIQSPCLSFLIHTANSRWLSILYGDVSFHVTLFIPLTLSSPLSMSISLLSMSVSPLLPCKEILQYHFSRFRIYGLETIFLFLFLTYFTLCNRLNSLSWDHLSVDYISLWIIFYSPWKNG